MKRRPRRRVSRRPIPQATQVRRKRGRARRRGGLLREGAGAQEILGDADDTQGLYYDPERWPETGGWDPVRVREVHDKIVAHFLAEANGVSYEEPHSLYMAGGSGVGKTSIQDLLDERGEIPPNAVVVNPDDIKEMLPEYDAMKEAGDKYAAWAVHEESSAIAKRIATEAQLKSYNTIVDGTGDAGYTKDGKLTKFEGKIQDDLDAGRYVSVVLVDAPLDQSQGRAIDRAERNGRWIPPVEISRVHQAVAARHFEWADRVEDWQMWATDSAPGGGRQKPWMVARHEYGITTVYDNERYNHFRSKANGTEPPGVTFERGTQFEEEEDRIETETRRRG